MWLAVVTALWIYRNKVIFDAGKVDEVEIFCNSTIACLVLGKI